MEDHHYFTNMEMYSSFDKEDDNDNDDHLLFQHRCNDNDNDNESNPNDVVVPASFERDHGEEQLFVDSDHGEDPMDDDDGHGEEEEDNQLKNEGDEHQDDHGENCDLLYPQPEDQEQHEDNDDVSHYPSQRPSSSHHPQPLSLTPPTSEQQPDLTAWPSSPVTAIPTVRPDTQKNNPIAFGLESATTLKDVAVHIESSNAVLRECVLVLQQEFSPTQPLPSAPPAPPAPPSRQTRNRDHYTQESLLLELDWYDQQTQTLSTTLEMVSSALEVIHGQIHQQVRTVSPIGSFVHYPQKRQRTVQKRKLLPQPPVQQHDDDDDDDDSNALSQQQVATSSIPFQRLVTFVQAHGRGSSSCGPPVRRPRPRCNLPQQLQQQKQQQPPHSLPLPAMQILAPKVATKNNARSIKNPRALPTANNSGVTRGRKQTTITYPSILPPTAATTITTATTTTTVTATKQKRKSRTATPSTTAKSNATNPKTPLVASRRKKAKLSSPSSLSSPPSSKTLTNNDEKNSKQNRNKQNNNSRKPKEVEKDENLVLYPPPKSPPLFSFLEIAQILQSVPRIDRDHLIGIWTRKRQIFISRQRCYSILDEYERTRQITEFHYPHPSDTDSTTNAPQSSITTTTTRRTMFSPPEAGALLYETAKEYRFEVLHLIMHKKQVPAGKSMLWNLLMKHKKGEYINPEWGSVGRRPLATTEEVKILLQQAVLATAAAATATAEATASSSDPVATTPPISTTTETRGGNGTPKTIGAGGGIMSSQAMRDALVHHQLLTNGHVVLPGRSTIRNYVHLATLTAAQAAAESVSSTTITQKSVGRIIPESRPWTTRAATVPTTPVESEDCSTNDMVASGTTDAHSVDDDDDDNSSSDMLGNEDDSPLDHYYHRNSSLASTLTGV